MERIKIVENGMYVDASKIKSIIIKWQLEELYEFRYKQGLRGERLYENILSDISIYIDDLVEETMQIEVDKLGLTKDYCFSWVDLYPKSDVRSIGIEVCNFLEALWGQPIENITTEDIPVILEFLDIPPDKTLEAWGRWEKYWANLDYPARRKKLLEDPKYN